MGFRRPEVQILSPRPSSEQGLHRLLRLFLQKSSRAHAAALPLSGRPSKKAALPCRAGPAARLFSFFSFSFGKASWEEGGGGPILSLPFPFDPLSRKRAENGREPGPDAREGRRRDRRADAKARAGGRRPGSRGRARARAGGETGGRAGGGGAGGGAQGMQKSRAEKAARLLRRISPLPDAKARAGETGERAGGGRRRGDAKEPGGEGRPAPVPDEKPRALPDTEERAGDRRTDARRWQAAGSRGRARAGISRWAQAARARAGGGPRRGCTWNRSKASEWGTAS